MDKPGIIEIQSTRRSTEQSSLFALEATPVDAHYLPVEDEIPEDVTATYFVNQFRTSLSLDAGRWVHSLTNGLIRERQNPLYHLFRKSSENIVAGYVMDEEKSELVPICKPILEHDSKAHDFSKVSIVPRLQPVIQMMDEAGLLGISLNDYEQVWQQFRDRRPYEYKEIWRLLAAADENGELEQFFFEFSCATGSSYKLSVTNGLVDKFQRNIEPDSPQAKALSDALLWLNQSRRAVVEYTVLQMLALGYPGSSSELSTIDIVRTGNPEKRSWILSEVPLSTSATKVFVKRFGPHLQVLRELTDFYKMWLSTRDLLDDLINGNCPRMLSDSEIPATHRGQLAEKFKHLAYLMKPTTPVAEFEMDLSIKNAAAVLERLERLRFQYMEQERESLLVSDLLNGDIPTNLQGCYRDDFRFLQENLKDVLELTEINRTLSSRADIIEIEHRTLSPDRNSLALGNSLYKRIADRAKEFAQWVEENPTLIVNSNVYAQALSDGLKNQSEDPLRPNRAEKNEMIAAAYKEFCKQAHVRTFDAQITITELKTGSREASAERKMIADRNRRFLLILLNMYAESKKTGQSFDKWIEDPYGPVAFMMLTGDVEIGYKDVYLLGSSSGIESEVNIPPRSMACPFDARFERDKSCGDDMILASMHAINARLQAADIAIGYSQISSDQFTPRMRDAKLHWCIAQIKNEKERLKTDGIALGTIAEKMIQLLRVGVDRETRLKNKKKQISGQS